MLPIIRRPEPIAAAAPAANPRLMQLYCSFKRRTTIWGDESNIKLSKLRINGYNSN